MTDLEDRVRQLDSDIAAAREGTDLTKLAERRTDLWREWMSKARAVAIDFDGVIHPYTAGWCGEIPVAEPPVAGVQDMLRWCQDQNFRTVVFSCRAETPVGRQGILDYLAKEGLGHLVDEVTHVKPPAVAYVDDRAVSFRGDWQAVRSEVARLAVGTAHTAQPPDPPIC